MAVAFILHFSCKRGLAILEGWIPQTTLGWSQETQVGTCTYSWCSCCHLVLINLQRLKSSTPPQLIVLLMVFINESILLSFPITSVVHLVYMCWYTVVILFWSITLMVKCYDDYVSINSLLSDCSELIKRGKSLLKASTLIHPPSQCGRCVQQGWSQSMALDHG